MKRTLIISYISQIYNALIGIIFVPIYMNYLSVEGFGLVGFFLMIQVWMQLLDVGISPTLARELSIFHAKAIDAITAFERFRALEFLIIILSIMGGACLFFLKDYIVNHWLSFKIFSPMEVSFCVVAISFASIFRLLVSFYRSGLIGLEKQLLVNVAGVIFSSLKFIGVIPILFYASSKIQYFFLYQAIIGLLELFIYAIVLYKKIPISNYKLFPSRGTYRYLLPSASAMSFTACIWILITQSDKLILSKLLSLEEYGYFTVAATVAGGLLIMIPPINQVIQPRLTILAAKQEKETLFKLYHLSTQIVVSAFIALGGTISIFSEQIIMAWTSNATTTTHSSAILKWYSLANALIGILVLPYMLQYSLGRFRFHVIGNAILSFTLLPTLFYTSLHFGGIGSGVTLLVFRSLFILLWIPVVYQKIAPDLNYSWLTQDVLPASAATIATLFIFSYTVSFPQNHLLILLIVGVIFLSALFVGLITGDHSRTEILKCFRMKTISHHL